MKLFLALVVFLVCAAPASAKDIIGLSLPYEGRFSPVAKRMEFGALMALEKLRKDNPELDIELLDDGCDSNKAAEKANALIAAKARIVVGPVCFRYAAALARTLNTTDGSTPTIPVIATGTRNDALERLRSFDGLPLFALSNTSDAEARAVVRDILPRFEGKPFALLDDGSVYGRGLADGIRLLAREAGLRPTQSMNFRPLQTTQLSLLRRLSQSGIEAVFIAGAPQDVVTIARDMNTLGLDWKIGTGEQAVLLPYTEGAREVPNGLLAVAEALPPLKLDPEVLALVEGEDAEKGNDLWLGHALVEIAAQALERGELELAGRSYDTVLGKITFDAKGRATALPIALFEWDGGGFRPVTPASVAGN